MNQYVIVDKGYRMLTFRNLHKRVGIGEETESGKTVFREPEFWQSFGQKTIDLNWYVKPTFSSILNCGIKWGQVP